MEEGYPHLDFYWIAMDQLGNVGLFFTGGKGPVPLAVLRGQFEHGQELEAAITSLPDISESNLLIRDLYVKPDDFIMTARNGIFAYDWIDVHRSPKTNAYELIASPKTPLMFNALPSGLKTMAQEAVLNQCVFGRDTQIKLTNQIECVEWRPMPKR